jgi:hypothetical protein
MFEEEETFWTTDKEDEMELTGGALALPPEILNRVLADDHLPVRIRRLTPVECERLQGFPDGWTVASPEAIARWGRSISTVLDGTSSDALARSQSSSGSARGFAPF